MDGSGRPLQRPVLATAGLAAWGCAAVCGFGAAHAEVSPLQALIAAAEPGATVEVPAGVYRGELVIDKTLHLIGPRAARLEGTSDASVVEIRAPGVVFEGFSIDGRGAGDLGKDSSGIHIAAAGVTLRDCHIEGTLFGVYLHEADDARVESCTIIGIHGKAAGEKGSGIHVWNSQRFVLTGNTIAEVRDGFYIQSSSNGVVRGNNARDLRYGLHYMYSDDNVFEDNLFANGDAGTAIMYSRRITFRRNRFLHNRGFASVGLLFKECEDVVAEDNLLADNARGIFLDGSYRGVFRRNVLLGSDAALVLYDSCADNRFEGNAFLANLSPLQLVGRRTETVFHGNYFSDNSEPDLDGDGRSDRPYRLSSVFDHLRNNLTAADLLAKSPAALALAAAEQAFPVLEPVPVLDDAPLAELPALAAFHLDPRPPSQASWSGLLVAAGCLAGALVLLRGARGPR